jgi:hypothetical protein
MSTLVDKLTAAPTNDARVIIRLRGGNESSRALAQRTLYWDRGVWNLVLHVSECV